MLENANLNHDTLKSDTYTNHIDLSENPFINDEYRNNMTTIPFSEQKHYVSKNAGEIAYDGNITFLAPVNKHIKEVGFEITNPGFETIKATIAAAPTVNDDSGDGYAIKDVVRVKQTDGSYIYYQTSDVSVGAAVWAVISTTSSVYNSFESIEIKDSASIIGSKFSKISESWRNYYGQKSERKSEIRDVFKNGASKIESSVETVQINGYFQNHLHINKNKDLNDMWNNMDKMEFQINFVKNAADWATNTSTDGTIALPSKIRLYYTLLREGDKGETKKIKDSYYKPMKVYDKLSILKKEFTTTSTTESAFQIDLKTLSKRNVYGLLLSLHKTSLTGFLDPQPFHIKTAELKLGDDRMWLFEENDIEVFNYNMFGYRSELFTVLPWANHVKTLEKNKISYLKIKSEDITIDFGDMEELISGQKYILRIEPLSISHFEMTREGGYKLDRN